MPLLSGLLLILFGILLIIILTSVLRINSFLSLFAVALILALAVLPLPEIVPALKKGFGDTMASIGLIIIFGTVIGVTLDVTGATLSMANFVLSKTGTGNSASAISITGFITGLPIFCDSGFIILSGLNRTITMKSRSNPVFMSTVLACSLYSVHCLIPPHPGATAAAGIIGANIGQLVMIGTLVAIPSALSAFIWARYMTSRGNMNTNLTNSSSSEDIQGKRKTPPALRSFLPIVIPLLLITLKSVLTIIFPLSNSMIMKAVGFAGDPLIALICGMLISFTLLPALSKESMNRILTTAIEKAGPIIIVTAAGGVFGSIIKETGTGEQVGTFLSKSGMGLLIPFLLAFILKTAQGSSTVAIITAASIMTPMMGALGYTDNTDLLLVTLSMGAGSMMVSHANDSYFWVVTNFSGISSSDSLRVYSTATAVMGVTAFVVILLLSVVM